MTMKTVLYRLTFPNGKVYIGVTDNPAQRWATKYKGSACGDAIAEFGWENVKKEVLVELEPTPQNNDTILRLEREFIKLYGDNSYNQAVRPEFYDRIVEKRTAKDNYRVPRLYWEIDGIRKPAREWCAEYGISMSQVDKRMHSNGLTLVQALSFPRVPRERNRDPIGYWRECGCFDEPTPRGASV